MLDGEDPTNFNAVDGESINTLDRQMLNMANGE